MRGDARLTASADLIRVRVRQLGFAAWEQNVVLSTAKLGTLVVRLIRASIVLPSRLTQSESTCGTDSGSQSLSLLALEQLRLAAQQFEAFRRANPFRVTLTRRTVRLGSDGRPKSIREGDEEGASAEWGDPYQPGQVINEKGGGFSASVLFVSALADSAFWSRHCLIVRQVANQSGHRLLPLEFYPSADVASADWAGTAWLDSATAEIQRIDFRLTGVERLGSLKKLEGYMTFVPAAPYVARPDSIVAAWWWNRAGDVASLPDEVQSLHVRRVDYKHKPY
jgi:hypothetical protein